MLQNRKPLNLNGIESRFTHRHGNQEVMAPLAPFSYLTLSCPFPHFALLASPPYNISAFLPLPLYSSTAPCPPNLYPLLLFPLTLSLCLLNVSLSGGEERLPRGTVVRSRCRLHWLNEEPAGRGECLCVCLRVSVFVSVPV